MSLPSSFRKQSRCLHERIFSTASATTTSTSIRFTSFASASSTTTINCCVSWSLHFANGNEMTVTNGNKTRCFNGNGITYEFLFRTTFMLGAYTRFGGATFGIRTEFRLPPRVRSRGNLNELNLSVLINDSCFRPEPWLTTVDDDGFPLYAIIGWCNQALIVYWMV